MILGVPNNAKNMPRNSISPPHEHGTANNNFGSNEPFLYLDTLSLVALKYKHIERLVTFNTTQLSIFNPNLEALIYSIHPLQEKVSRDVLIDKV